MNNLEQEFERFSQSDTSQEKFKSVGLDRDQVTQEIERFRWLLEIAWSKGSVLPSLKESPDTGRFKSTGQCFPTAILLKSQLEKEHPNIVGQVRIKSGQMNETGYTHAWIEIPTEEDGGAIVIDVTPDQEFAISSSSTVEIIVSLKKDLESQDIYYQGTDVSINDLDESTKKRVDRLERRFNRVLERENFYRELFRQNIYIVGSVATGKTELLGRLKEVLPQQTVDVGKLFRVVSYLVIHDEEGNAVNPDFEKLSEGNTDEVDRIIGSLYRKTRLLRTGLIEKTTIQNHADSPTVLLDGHDISDQLDDEQINTLVPVIAQNSKVRELIWEWIHNFADDNGVLLTGHSLREIDTTRYKIIHLLVSDNEAAARFMERTGFDSKDEALEYVRQRNMEDRSEPTARLLEKAYGVDAIDTDSRSPQEIGFRALRRIVESTRDELARVEQQKLAKLKKEDFEWQINPLLSAIRAKGADVFREIATEHKKQGITEFDIAVQTMIHLSGRETSEVWNGDTVLLSDIENLILLGEVEAATQKMSDAISKSVLSLKQNVVKAEAERQCRLLLEIYQNTQIEINGETVKLPAEYMGNPDKSPFGDNAEVSTKGSQYNIDSETGGRELVVCDNSSGKKITIKRVPSEISKMYGAGFHYLHSGRSDELVAFGAYAEGDDLPFAWVSYSPVDRDYKKEMLHYLGVESHTVLEMTRAWNATWSPKNTMSTMFAFAHEELQREWKRKLDVREVDKPLQGVITAINGNLGFRANAFNGVGFETCGLKPAKFTFLRDNDSNLLYSPRRTIVQELGLSDVSELSGNPDFTTNQFPLLPINEMIVLFDKRRMKELSERPIYKISSKGYGT